VEKGIRKAGEMIFPHTIRSALPVSHADKMAALSLSFAVMSNKTCALQAYEDAIC
jgi:hypothetical protein